MSYSRTIIFLLALVGASAHAQSWSAAYEKALTALKEQKWTDARAAFKEASALRPEDFSGPTVLPGPVTDPKKWRNGAPYSPNFGAAYAAFKIANGASTNADQVQWLNTAAKEFETLLDKGQSSKESFYFLNGAYTMLRAVEKQQQLEKRLADQKGKFLWKIDLEIPTPEEEAAVVAALSQSGGVDQPGDPNPQGGTTQGTTSTQAGAVNTGPLTGFAGRVPVMLSKYALIIGNTEGRLTEGGMPYANENALLVRESLVQNAGYAEGNIDIVLNATAETMRASAKALADRLPADATVLVYFAGTGVNVAGKDYLVGVDTELSTDTSTMFAKSELYQMFMAKGARVFAFFESGRNVDGGRYFGMEVPMVGSISQVQATIPGGSILGFVRNGKPVGVFASAFSSVLNEFRSNRIPILEFGWQVFYRMRKGDTGYVGGGSTQTPTLPVLTNMAADARF